MNKKFFSWLLGVLLLVTCGPVFVLSVFAIMVQQELPIPYIGVVFTGLACAAACPLISYSNDWEDWQ